MFKGQQVNFFQHFVAFVTLLLAASCTIPRHYPPDKPFVYKTNVEVKGRLHSYEKKDLGERLLNQLDDSMKTRVVSYAGVLRVLGHPPVFDTINMGRSRTFMKGLLNSIGYFKPVITDTFHIYTVRHDHHFWNAWRSIWGKQSKPATVERRVVINFTVSTGSALRVDSIGYALETPELQRLAVENRNNGLVKKGKPYTDQAVTAEMDRLLTLYRDNGYFKITKDDIYAERDTVVSALIDPTLDPFEQVRLLDSLRRKRDNPTITVVIRQRKAKDSTHTQKYHVGNVYVSPDLYMIEDTTQGKDTATVRGYHFFTNTNKFSLPFVADNISLEPGALYRQSNYYRTINTFTQLGAWQQVAIDMTERQDSIPVVDAGIRLYPAKKQSFNIDLEGSRNTGDYLTTSQLFGVGVNARLLNRNAFRQSIQSSTSGRFGIELGKQLVQTVQTSISHTITFPKLFFPLNSFNKASSGITNKHTILNLAAIYTDRRDFFRVRTFNASWGYEWTSKNRITWQWVIPNFEYTTVLSTDSLNRLTKNRPTLRFAFNNGMVISSIVGMSIARAHGNHVNFFKTGVEESGALTGFIERLELGDLQRFIKGEAEFKHFINYNRSTLAFRVYGGYGYGYGKKKDTAGKIVNEDILPFYKAFFAGGPYSMRAWPVRRLGWGSNIFNDTVNNGPYDRFGDIKIESNAEYRFDVTTIADIKIKSAFFVDVGNVWLRHTSDPAAKSGEFAFNNLFRDLAIGAGTSIRFDFDFFLIRLDWAYRLKDPLYSNINGGWLHDIRLLNGQFQLGIGYPF